MGLCSSRQLADVGHRTEAKKIKSSSGFAKSASVFGMTSFTIRVVFFTACHIFLKAGGSFFETWI